MEVESLGLVMVIHSVKDLAPSVLLCLPQRVPVSMSDFCNTKKARNGELSPFEELLQ